MACRYRVGHPGPESRAREPPGMHAAAASRLIRSAIQLSGEEPHETQRARSNRLLPAINPRSVALFTGSPAARLDRPCPRLH
uniref:Uncharacterized protein n=1 Tax=Zea mays TaxID=4577 RepID=C0HIL4_MAIZE|nr:unknown [Zea mays]